jgi:hypothetical protein
MAFNSRIERMTRLLLLLRALSIDRKLKHC